MQKQLSKVLSILVAISFLASCATTSGPTQTTAQPTEEAAATSGETQQADQTAQPAEPSTTPGPAPDSPEKQIFRQSILTGAVLGAAIGAGAGALIDGKNPGIGALAGGLAGAVVGGLVGSVVGKKQIESYRNIKMTNENFEKLLTRAKEYNDSVVAYNNNLEQEIKHLKIKTKPEQERIAKEKLREAEEQRTELAQRIDERQMLSNTLVQPQMVEYQNTLSDLNKEGKKLDGIIAQLRSISGPARIGS